MNEGIKKFEELLKTDESFKAKLQAAAEAYTGEENEEAVFNGVLLPVAKEYGISASYEELKDYIGNLASTDEIMDEEELKQIAGSKGGGFGAGVCYGVGIGWGAAGGDGGSVACIVVGHGTKYCCLGEGDPHGDTCKECPTFAIN